MQGARMIWFPHGNVHLDKRILLVELDDLPKPLKRLCKYPFHRSPKNFEVSWYRVGLTTYVCDFPIKVLSEVFDRVVW